MSVYVDSLINYKWKLGPSCHLLGDSEEELHIFARRIGLKRSWFQKKDNGTPHYDLTENKRKIAIDNGAIEINRKQVYRIIQYYRKIEVE
jgi:hypothetical protein